MNTIKQEPYRTRIATYNIGDFFSRKIPRGSEEGKVAFREAMQAVGAELWALQEDALYYNEETQEGPYEAIYNFCKNYERRYTGPYNYKAYLSDLEIRDVDQIYYQCTKRVGHKWFLRATVTLGGRDICLVNVHFDWSDKEVRRQQIDQAIAYASKYEYAVIIGDFNPHDYVDGVLQSERLLMEEEAKIFEDAGYAAANGGAFGLFRTGVNKPGMRPIDNIVVSHNIRIEAVDAFQADWMTDHAILWADIVIE